MPEYRLSPKLSEKNLSRQFRSQGWVQINEFMSIESAQALHESVSRRTDWQRAIASDGKILQISRHAWANLPSGQKQQVEQTVYLAARTGFQFRYETVKVPQSAQDRNASDDPLHRFAQWMSEGPAREFLRAVTGASGIDFADAQATAYSPGDFLTGHDDGVTGQNRKAAYVLGLTPAWRLEWGGLLMFHGNDGQVDRGLVPGFNTLNVFAVPRIHSVSEVTRAAPVPRYSVTGWLRGG